jgi:hypothetical protein
MWMKLTSKSEGTGLTYIVLWINRASQLISCSREHRDISAAKLFFTQAINQHGPPEKITVDGYPATHTALNELKAQEILPQSTQVRTSKYLNHLTLAGPSKDQAANLSNAGIQEICKCRDDDQRN